MKSKLLIVISILLFTGVKSVSAQSRNKMKDDMKKPI